MSEREGLLTAFFAAAAVDGEWVRDWAKGDSVAEWAHPKAGDEVQMDGDFNIWAGIQAVVALAKEAAWDEGHDEGFDYARSEGDGKEHNPHRTPRANGDTA